MDSTLVQLDKTNNFVYYHSQFYHYSATVTRPVYDDGNFTFIE